jgi:hypothetical protein
MNKFGLINHEGDCLWAIRDKENVVVYDQWRSLVSTMSIQEFCSWIDGEIGLTDSHDKTWYWTKEHREAKPSMFKLLNFLK